MFVIAAAGTSHTGMVLVTVLFAFAWLVFGIWMLADCVTEEKEIGSKIAWILAILFAGALGVPLYYFLRKRPRDKLRLINRCEPEKASAEPSAGGNAAPPRASA